MIPFYNKILARTSSLGGSQYVRETLAGNNPQVIQECFQMLCRTLELFQTKLLQKDLLSSSWYIDITKKLAIFLVAVGDRLSFQWLQDRFQHSGKTISCIFNEVLRAMVKLSLDYLCLSSLDKPLASQICNNSKYYLYFEDCLGALDGTHIMATVLAEEQNIFRNCKDYIS